MSQPSLLVFGAQVIDAGLDVFFHVLSRGGDAFTDVVGFAFGGGLVAFAGVGGGFFDGTPGLLGVSLYLLRGTFVGELLVIESFAGTLLYFAGNFIKLALDGAIGGCAHGGIPFLKRGESALRKLCCALSFISSTEPVAEAFLNPKRR